MKMCYRQTMNNAILQVRDVPPGVIATLRERADRQGISLSAYVRSLLADDAAQPTMDEVIARITTRDPIEISDEEILVAIREGRR